MASPFKSLFQNATRSTTPRRQDAVDLLIPFLDLARNASVHSRFPFLFWLYRLLLALPYYFRWLCTFSFTLYAFSFTLLRMAVRPFGSRKGGS
jgi:hypothetical protein